jgi:hypothetical protein
MDYIAAAILLQSMKRDFNERFPEFTHVVTTPFMQAANRDPDYVEIYPENVHKWTFPFLFAFLTEFTEC